MSFFRRGRKSEGDLDQAATTETSTAGPEGGTESAERPDRSLGTADDAPDTDDAPETGDAPDTGDAEAATPAGPYDASEVPEDDGRLDLGALRIVGVPGMELRLEIEEAAQQVVGATAVLGDSAVQLQAFAAPKSSGIWDAIRGEIAESVVGQGGTADEGRGELGTELRTRVPSAGPDGRTVYAPARFVGVDGPRWFLRAVFSGRAAIDEEAAAPLMRVVRETVVVRGAAAMAPRELLPLRLPDQSAPGQEGEAQGRNANDLNPFERGPEITEVR